MNKLPIIIAIGLAAVLASCQQDAEPVVEANSQANLSITEEPEPDSLMVNAYELNRVINKYSKAVGMPVSRAAENEVYTVNDGEGAPVLYIVNKANDGGFFIVSARKNATPLLAYNDKGNFDLDALKSSDTGHPMVTWIENIKDAILADELADSVTANTWKSFEAFSASNLSANSRSLDNAELNRLRALMMDKTAEWSSDPETKVYTFEEFRIAYPERAEYYSEVLPGGMIYLGYYEDYEQLTLFVERSESTMYSSNVVDIRWAQSDADDRYNSWNKSYPTYKSKVDNKTYHYPAGCGAVAAGQIMRCAEFPSSFDWNNMPLNYPTSTTSDFLLEIATKSNATFRDDSDGKEAGVGIEMSNLVKTLQSFGYNAKYIDRFQESELVPPCIVSSETKLDGVKKDSHAWTVMGSRYFVNKRVLSCWTFPVMDTFREVEKQQISIENSSILRYVNWGAGGDGNCWMSNLKYACPPRYSSGTATEMIVNINHN